MADQLHSVLLLAALVCGLGVAAAAGAALVRARHIRPRPVLALLCAVGAFGAAFFGAGSAVVHLRFRHGGGSPEPMTLPRFLLVHEAYWVVLGCVAVSVVGWMIAQRWSGSKGR
jgi:hypothetical protein